MGRAGHVVLVLAPVRLNEQAQRLQGVNSGGGSSISSRWVQYVKVADLEAASRQRPLMAGTNQSGAQVGCRKPVIQGGPVREILSGSPGSGYGRERVVKREPVSRP